MTHATSYQKRDSCSAEACERGREREGAGTAFRGILLRQPESVDGEACSSQSQKEKTNEKPWQRAWAEIEDLAEGERDEHHHQSKKESECAAAAEPLCQRRHGQAAEDRGKRNQHHAVGGDLCGGLPDVATSFGQR